MHVMIVIVTIVVPLPSDLDVDAKADPGGVAVIAGNRVVQATQPATKAPARIPIATAHRFTNLWCLRFDRPIPGNR